MNETSADKSVATKRAATSSSAVKQVIPSPSAVSSATSSDTRFDDVALIFEGGGMRAAYTAAVVKTLVDAGIVFSKVYGISAGSALLCFTHREIPSVPVRRLWTRFLSKNLTA